VKRDFASRLHCPFCGGGGLALEVASEDAVEVREGTLRCAGCGRVFPIRAGIGAFLDPADEVLRREIAGWHTLAGELGEGLVPTMTALPYYPHEPWPHTAPDFFQIFEAVDLAGRRVVDLGAGRTWSTRFLLTLGRAKEAVAVDILTRRFLGLETAEVFFREDGIFFERLRADLHRTPLPDGWAGAVFSAASLHHSSDLPAVIAEAWRLLEPGGVFVFVSEPSKKESIEESRPDNEETRHGINEHVYAYREYVVPLRRRGFRVRRLVPRSITYRMLYPDEAFESGLTPFLRRLGRTARGRSLARLLLGAPIVGASLYRGSSLPLSLVATKPA
jgi:SAM-dependent methyltransferase/uncharacterized protein YbaR (Trm112 family)